MSRRGCRSADRRNRPGCHRGECVAGLCHGGPARRIRFEKLEQYVRERSGSGGTVDLGFGDSVQQCNCVGVDSEGRLTFDHREESRAEGEDVAGFGGVVAAGDFGGEVGGVPVMTSSWRSDPSLLARAIPKSLILTMPRSRRDRQ